MLILMQKVICLISPNPTWLNLAGGNYDDAKLWAEKAGYFLRKNDQQEARNNLAETALSQNDLPTVSKTIDAMNEEQRQSAQSLIKHYEQARSGKIVG